jgi:hypothetical protein
MSCPRIDERFRQAATRSRGLPNEGASSGRQLASLCQFSGGLGRVGTSCPHPDAAEMLAESVLGFAQALARMGSSQTTLTGFDGRVVFILAIVQTAIAAGYLTGIGTNTVADVPYTILGLNDLAQPTNWSHIVTLCSAPWTHSIGLKDVWDALQLNSGPLSALRGATPPSRNNLSHANKVRDPVMAEKLFWAVFAHWEDLSPGFVNGHAAKRFARKFKRTIQAVDSTTIQLVARCLEWATPRRPKAAAKGHLRLDLQSFWPRFAIIDARARPTPNVRGKCAPASKTAKSSSLTRLMWSSTLSACGANGTGSSSWHIMGQLPLSGATGTGFPSRFCLNLWDSQPPCHRSNVYGQSK